ncbi:MAG: hypothetical protein RL380_443 [Verrucomicrobiota bacterium]|jgi:transcription elongation GreA/GreB family factor
MNKRTLLKKILAQLQAELAVYVRASLASRTEATHESSKAESKYDTRGLEASYLAHGQSKQAMEIEAAIAEFGRLEARQFADGDAIGIGALVQVEVGGEKSFYFLGPRAGGTEVVQDKNEILVITPSSPLGSQLVGRRAGESLPLTLGGGRQAAQIISVD